MKTWMIALSLTLAASSARADQCAWIDAGVAQKAQTLLAKKPMTLEFCEPCGDKAPGVPTPTRSVAIGSPHDDYKEIQINGKGVDLAYTYVKTSATKYQNLAKLAGCHAEDVSPSLTIAEETANGVLITASNEAPPPPPVIATVPIAVPVPAPPREPATIYVYSSSTERMPWLTAALASVAGFVIGAGFLLTALALRRRRRAMRPRATDL